MQGEVAISIKNKREAKAMRYSDKETGKVLITPEAELVE